MQNDKVRFWTVVKITASSYSCNYGKSINQSINQSINLLKAGPKPATDIAVKPLKMYP